MMTATTETDRPLPDQADTADTAQENGTRAGLYAALSHLFHARPDAGLLRSLAAAEAVIGDEAGALGQTWRDLCAAARITAAEVAGAQYDALFLSAGLPAVSPYASGYLQGRRPVPLLAGLREDLATLGFARAPGSTEYEDHIAALCDVMRGLIGEEGQDAQAHERQRAFFRDYLGPWYSRFSEQIISAAPEADFYASVARFTDAFLTHESHYFELA